ncbi:MAG TPA: NADPH:quinone oxidoreductase family protein [Acidimicrobiales bacterium]|nr:NADPH:quinone oxidoreductase family protein [Acidimicrobiales bacterium]
MRAWRAHHLGEPFDVLRLEEVDEPVAGPGELLVDIDATGLAYPEVLMCQGKYQGATPIPYTPGGEVAGRVAAVGDGVTTHRIGDRVVTMGGKGLAERSTVRAALSFAVPEAVPSAKAAAVIVNYGTSWFALHERAALQPGEWLLVHGGAGGVGSSAVQLGLAAGARVIATAGGTEKVDLCRSLGAHHVIDYRSTPDFVDEVREVTGGHGVDVCYDPVGGDVFRKSQRCMAWDGRLLIIGFVGGIADAPTNHILLKNYSVVGVHWGASLARDPTRLPRAAERLLAMTAAGEIDPLLYPPYPMEEGSRALQDLADRRTWGKPIVEPRV